MCDGEIGVLGLMQFVPSCLRQLGLHLLRLLVNVVQVGFGLWRFLFLVVGLANIGFDAEIGLVLDVTLDLLGVDEITELRLLDFCRIMCG